MKLPNLNPFRKQEAEVTAPQEEAPQLPKGYTPKKGKATPRRKTVEASNRRPLVADKTKLTREERRERKAQERAKQDTQWQIEQEAMRTGDETRMPVQYRGKARRFGRDYVDASAPISGWFMPLAILLIPLMMFSGRFPQITMVLTLVFYVLFILMLLQAIYVANMARKLAARKFGELEIPRGYRWQLIGRCFYPRRWRMPKPQVSRRQFPEGGTKADVKAMRAERKARKRQLGV